jgi:hypothetical protein
MKTIPDCQQLRTLFWDVAFDSIDWRQHARFVINRVVTRGNLEDWFLLKKIYGCEKIKKEVLCIRSLDAKTLNFLSIYFGVKKADFRCCS